MALRSSVSQLSPSSAPRTAPIEDQPEVKEAPEAVTPRSTPRSLNRYAGASAPAAEQAAVEPAVAGRGRGRPRKALGTGDAPAAAGTAPKAARKPRAIKAPLSGSPSELRAQLKQTEGDILALKDAVAAATARFQPKIEALRAKHADLSAQLSAALLK